MRRLSFYDNSEPEYCKLCEKDTDQGYSDYHNRAVCWSCIAREEREQKAFELATFAKVQNLLNLTDKEMKIVFPSAEL